MLVVIILTILTLVVPLVIMKPFSDSQKTLAFVIVLAHLSLMFFLHYRLVSTTGHSVIIDGNIDAQKYYNWTEQFATAPPFSVTRRDIRGILLIELSKLNARTLLFFDQKSSIFDKEFTELK